MTKLIETTVVTLVVVVVSFVASGLHSFRISGPDSEQWSSLLQETDMMDGSSSSVSGQIEYEGRVYPPPEGVKASIQTKIGQIGGLDTLEDGSLLVFHRGQRTWGFNSFLRGDKFNEELGPIAEDTITLLDWKTASEIQSWGKNQFYMPHGLTVDPEGKIWVTDVGLHQVLKFDLNRMDKPELVLGEKFQPGNDESHFCKPTKVSVSKLNGHVFVADGYCNKRVVEFDKSGKFVRNYEDAKNPMLVVHGIALIEPLGLVCAASREQGRIVCFDTTSGEKKQEIKDARMKTVYGIRYDTVNKVLHAATGDNHNQAEPTGLSFDASSLKTFGTPLKDWKIADRDLTRVHDLTTSPDGSRIFMGQLNSEIDMFSA